MLLVCFAPVFPSELPSGRLKKGGLDKPFPHHTVTSFSGVPLLGGRTADHQARNALAMEGSVAEGDLTGLGAAIQQMGVVFPGKSHAALHLYTAISHFAAGVAGVSLRYADRYPSFRTSLRHVT